LVNPGNNDRLRPLYCDLLAAAEAHLEAGWEYTNMIPRRFVRVRLACAWPILIGVRTAAKLRNGNCLASVKPIKISRTEVRRLVARSVLGQIWPPLWRRLLHESKLV
jgi:farnesyl-diphosphate farnesyltransferase